MRIEGIEFDPQAIGPLCKRAGVVRLWVFGSVVRGGFGAQSDIDVLVETDPAHPAGLLVLGGLQMDLSDLLGRPVHLTLLGSVPAADRARTLSQARLLDAA